MSLHKLIDKLHSIVDRRRLSPEKNHLLVESLLACIRAQGGWHYHRDESLDALSWGRKYLAAHFVKRPSRMHEWLNLELTSCRTERGHKINLIGPRGGAKSTIGTLCYVLQAAVHGWERYIWIVSDTKQQAQTHLENVKLELVENTELAANYPHATGRGPRWQATAIELNNGVVIESYGTGQAIRGRRRREHRPTLIVCDDLQNDSHISSAPQPEASRRWFHGTLLKAGTKRTNVLNLATALHRDALAMELLTAAGWHSQRFAAIECWPTNLDLWQKWEEIYTGHREDKHSEKLTGQQDFSGSTG